MALRLPADLAASSAPPAGAPPVAAPPAAETGPVALGAWRAAWAAAAQETPARRHARRLRLIEELLGDAGGHRPADLASRLLALADALVAALEDAPREPLLLNHAGVALYELGALRAADALFRAAERLDPQLPFVAGNRAEIRRRRAAGLGGTVALDAAAARRLKVLGERARRVAARARPAEGLTLSLCMIVRDEEAMLPACLSAVAHAVDELVIVDTGSVDRTVEIAESFGARVLHHPWTGDFAAARNVSFDAATGDWLLYLDADEVLVDDDAQHLRALTGHVWREALYLRGASHTGDLDDGTAVTHDSLRLFRNRPGRRFAGRLHEQVQGLEELTPDRFAVTDVRFEHYGYLGEVRAAKGKRTRNRDALAAQIADGDRSPFVRFNLGMEHRAEGEHEEALVHFRGAWEDLRGVPDGERLGFVPMLALHLVDALHVTGRRAEAAERAREVLDRYPGFTDVVHVEGALALDAGDLSTAEARFRRCLELGDAPSAMSGSAGAGTFLAARALAGVLQRQERRHEAIALLEGTLRDHPRHLRTVEDLALALRADGVDADEVVARVAATGVGEHPVARYLLGRALLRTGAVAGAEAQLRTALAGRPGSDAARVALVEALLAQGRFDDAAREAAAVAPEGPHGPAARRHACFARLAGADDGSVPLEGLDRLPPAEAALFAAWATPGADGPPIAAGAAPLARTMLGALLRLQRFEAFERLVAAHERVDLPWRERRETLADLYLRHGFLSSAGEEWLRVVDRQGPDARALRGLALVAAQSGMTEDAVALAADAEALAGRPLEEIA
jgi:tetratricopeptide (TPR) repeat protein